MTPQMIAALGSGRALLTGFFEIALPSGTRRLMLGSSEVPWSGNTFVGYDAAIGSIDSPDDVGEDMTGQAPNTSLNINISPTAIRADIAGQAVQLSPFKFWLAALQLNGTTQAIEVVPDPEFMFDGFIDQATIDLDKNRDDLEYTVISAFDYFFEDGEGQRLNGQFHQSVWTGEKGLDNVTGVTRKIYWGTLGPNTATSAGGGTPGGGGGVRDYRYLGVGPNLA